MSAPITLADRYPRQARLTRALLLVSAVLLAVGIFAPIFSLEKFFVARNTVSLIGACAELLREGQWLLLTIIALFSIVLPWVKIVLLFVFWQLHVSQRQRLAGLMHAIALYGKWSMLDVFVVALLLVSIKLGAVASVEVHYGLYAFAAAVLLTMVSTSTVMRLSRQLDSLP